MAPLLAQAHRFTVNDYYRMAETGILSPDDKVELLEGQIVTMSPIGRDHIGGVNRLANWLGRQLREQAVVQVQMPVSLDEHSEPEPDIAILKPRDDYYGKGKATPDDVLLLIEVAQSSLERDRDWKVPLYARHGIVECWLVDLVSDRIHVYRDASAEGYRTVQSLRESDSVGSQAFPEVVFNVGAALGR